MKAYIYTIRSHQTDQIYIGSTFQQPSMRMCKHRANYKSWMNQKYHYVSSFEILKFPDNYVEILLEVEVQSKLELHRLEGEQIRKLDCVNKRIAGRTQQEYNKDNAVHIAEHNANYRQENAVHIYTHNAKYNKENAVKIADQQSKKYQKNAKKISEQNAKKITCECGCIIATGNKVKHLKTQKHLTLMRTLTLLPVVSSVASVPIVKVVVPVLG